MLREGAANLHGEVKTKTSTMDVVTSTDMAAEKLIVERIAAAFPDDGYSVWDVAAGAVIAREAGCVVSGLGEGSEPTAERAMAATPDLMPTFRSLVRERIEAATNRDRSSH